MKQYQGVRHGDDVQAARMPENKKNPNRTLYKKDKELQNL